MQIKNLLPENTAKTSNNLQKNCRYKLCKLDEIYKLDELFILSIQISSHPKNALQSFYRNILRSKALPHQTSPDMSPPVYFR